MSFLFLFFVSFAFGQFIPVHDKSSFYSGTVYGEYTPEDEFAQLIWFLEIPADSDTVHVSRQLHHQGPSGAPVTEAESVIIGRGYRFVDKSPEEIETDLKKAFVDPEVIEVLKQASGLFSKLADDFISKHSNIILEVVSERLLFDLQYNRAVIELDKLLKNSIQVDRSDLSKPLYKLLLDLEFCGHLRIDAVWNRLKTMIAEKNYLGLVQFGSDPDVWIRKVGLSRKRFKKHQELLDEILLLGGHAIIKEL